MTRDAALPAEAPFDGADGAALARLLALPRVHAVALAASTQDVAHALAERGAPDGTLVLADVQTAGRGRQGRRWVSGPGAGIWLTLVARDIDPGALPVLSIRLGLHAAPSLDRFADAPVRLKWPNDLYLGRGKLAGILAEARWQASALAWVAVGVGLNVVAPADVPAAAGLRPGTARLDVLAALVPALRAALAARGALTTAELEAYAARDLTAGRRCETPVPGVVRGLAPDGALRVDGADGPALVRSGSLTLAPDRA